MLLLGLHFIAPAICCKAYARDENHGKDQKSRYKDAITVLHELIVLQGKNQTMTLPKGVTCFNYKPCTIEQGQDHNLENVQAESRILSVYFHFDQLLFNLCFNSNRVWMTLV